MIYDVAIIGAGPCGLAAAARLREPSPSALFTDVEHSRFWGRQHDKNTVNNEHKKTSPTSLQIINKVTPDRSIIVFDTNSDQWMSSWRSKFQSLKISHLRSPLFFHPDPQDRDGLLAFAHFEDRVAELLEIQNVVGHEVSKHKRKNQSARHLQLDNRDKNDYFTPSTALFDSYIDFIVKRYDLSDLLRHTTITDITYGYVESEGINLFTLTTPSGLKYQSHTVVVATGPANIPQIPLSCPLLSHSNQNGSACHIYDSKRPLLPNHVTSRSSASKHTEIMIVGGGLTSAQTVDLLLTHYSISKVHLVLRSKLKVKHFDVDLPWVAKLRNRKMATFWSADTDEERFEMLRNARGGGSVTPAYDRVLKEWQRKGRLEIHTQHVIDAQNDDTKWDDDMKVWRIALISSASPKIDLADTQSKYVKIIASVDHIIFATSTPPHINNVPCLQSLMDSHPITHVHGLPVLTQELAWHKNIPLFMTGALAGLRLGPGAGNLAGARLGAERVAWAIDEILEFTRDHFSEDDTIKSVSESRRDSGYVSEDGIPANEGKLEHKDLLNDCTRGLGNQFECLALLDSC